MQIENEHDKAIAYHDTIAPKMEEKSSKKSYSSSDITIERSIYFFYWLFKFARSVVVKSRSAFLFPDLHKQKTDRHERLFTSICLLFYFFTFLLFYLFTFLPLKDWLSVFFPWCLLPRRFHCHESPPSHIWHQQSLFLSMS